MSNYTKSQSDFINSDAKFIRLLAPAGCGKTFSIIEKARNIIAKKNRARIHMFTFTRGAADEIRQRCNDEDCVSANTLNSWGNNYIKTNTLKNPKILNTLKDRQFCFSNFLQPIWGDKPEYKDTFGKMFSGKFNKNRCLTMLDIVDQFKNIGFLHTDFSGNYEQDKKIYDEHLKFIKKVDLERYYNTLVDTLIQECSSVIKTIKDKDEFIVKHWIPFWGDCCEQMRAMGVYTFDDQKYFANIELNKKVQRGERWNGATKIDYIFVDEFQDTSPLDLMLISNLQKLNDAGLIIVGDDDQSIYEFRGAAPYFILHPDEIFGNMFTTFLLDENFRSPKNIVEKSMKLISYNKNREPKTVKSSTAMDLANINLKVFDTQEQMIDDVVAEIKRIARETNQTVAVLSRLKASLLPYQVLLTKEQVDYKVSADLAFFLTDAAASLNRVMAIKQKGNRINREDLIELVCLACRNQVYPKARNTIGRTFLKMNTKPETIRAALATLATEHPKEFRIFDDTFIENFESLLQDFLAAENVYETLDCLLNNFDGLKQNYSRSMEDLYFREPPLRSLLDFASKYGDDYDGFLDDFNAAIEKAKFATEENETLQNSDDVRVILSTALRVKGRQYDQVFILNVDDGIWPKSQSQTSPEAYEAERRLFYVAATRSKQTLSLYRANTCCGKSATASPFIFEGEYDK